MYFIITAHVPRHNLLQDDLLFLLAPCDKVLENRSMNQKDGTPRYTKVARELAVKPLVFFHESETSSLYKPVLCNSDSAWTAFVSLFPELRLSKKK